MPDHTPTAEDRERDLAADYERYVRPTAGGNTPPRSWLLSIYPAPLAWLRRAIAAEAEVLALRSDHDKMQESLLGHFRHMGLQHHCDWHGHPLEQVVSCEVSMLLAHIRERDAEIARLQDTVKGQAGGSE